MSNRFDNLFKIATVVSLQQINQSIQALGCSDIDKLNQKIENIVLEIAKAKDAGSDAKNLQLLLEHCLKVKKEYYEALEREALERRKQRRRALIVVIVSFIALIIILTISSKCDSSSSKKQSTVETIRCYNCKSTEVYGYAYFYYDDRTECSGSREYCLSHADYTLAQCHNCMRYQKITREQWQRLGKK